MTGHVYAANVESFGIEEGDHFLIACQIFRHAVADLYHALYILCG